MKDTVVVLPTYNEADNLCELLPKLLQCDVDILVVDDSPNPRTKYMAESFGVPVLSRIKPGRASAILDGIAATKHPNIVSMDADLQHPAEVVPTMLDALRDYDVVIASRNVPGGGYEGFTKWRTLVSYAAKLLAYPLVPQVKDKTSAFVAFRRDVLNGAKPSGGFSTLTLSLLVTGDYKTVKEVPYVFAERRSGDSKLSKKMMLNHLVQLAKLYVYKFRRVLKFAIVGASGALIHLGVLFALTESTRLHYLASYSAAFVVALTSNYVLNSLWTFKQNRGASGWLKYAFAYTPSLAVSMLLMYVLTDIGGLWYMLSAATLIFVAFVVNYTLSVRFVWARH